MLMEPAMCSARPADSAEANYQQFPVFLQEPQFPVLAYPEVFEIGADFWL